MNGASSVGAPAVAAGTAGAKPAQAPPPAAPSTGVTTSSVGSGGHSRRPSVDSSDSDDDGAGVSRQNTLNPNGGGANGAADGQRKLNRKERRALKSKHRKINPKHPEFELTYDMMLGIRTVVGNNPIGHSLLTPAASTTAMPVDGSPAASASHVAAQKKEAADAEIAAKRARARQEALMFQTLKLTFPGRGSSHTPAHAMRDFKFKDYSADVFRKIRDRFKIDPTEYLLSVCGNFQYLEFISNSKSGQFFFYSHDRQYMIKTISPGECKFLRAILPSYLEHIQSNPHTLLTRFYGMHRIKPHKKKEVHFLIMGSVFATSRFVHTVFDLKGSRQGRYASQKEKDSGAAVYKDNDFLDMKIEIKLGPQRAKLLNQQIAADVEWLAKLNIMDYSLLLGIHYKDRQAEHEGASKHVSLNGAHHAATGGAVATNEAREGFAAMPGDHADFEVARPVDESVQIPADALQTPARTPALQRSPSVANRSVSPVAMQPLGEANTQERVVITVEAEEEEEVLPNFHYDSDEGTTSGPSTPPNGRLNVGTASGNTSTNASPRGMPMTTPNGDHGPFSSRTWAPGQQPARVARSQSVLPHLVHSPTSAAAALNSQAEAAALSKKEAAALAKLDAIAKQTAYGLPKKYNIVSKPGDIAFPFEFEYEPSAASSQPNSPLHAHGAFGFGYATLPLPSSGSPLGASMPGAHTAFDSLSPAASARGRTSAGNTPTHQPTIGTDDVPAAGWELPPPLFAPSTPTQPPRPARALSVFASPSSREAQNFSAARDRGFSTGQRSILQSPGPAQPPPPSPAMTPVMAPMTVDHHQAPMSVAGLGSASAVAATHVGTSPRLVPAAPGIPLELSNAHIHPHDASPAVAAAAVVDEQAGTPAVSSPACIDLAAHPSMSPDALDLFGTDGGCAGQNPDGTPNNELYFMGVIDILTLYSLGKKLENFGKSLKYNEDDISAVSPVKYADRFKQFIAASLR